MALTPTISVSQGGSLIAARAVTADVKLTMAGALSVYNFPAERLDISQAGTVVTTSRFSTNLRISQAGALVVARGRIDSPKIRVWPFTLDEHDYYVVRLGAINTTLVYDTFSRQWYVWGSNDGNLWRAYTGTNWLSGRRFAPEHSSVIVGDDGNGALYFLSPDDDNDDDALEGEALPRPFTRTVTAQMFVDPGYSRAPCFGVQLFGSIGSGEDILTVKLEASDDRGHSYTDLGEVTINNAEYNERVHWRSLGSMRAPGRLFKVTDTGALKRIDSLEMDENR